MKTTITITNTYDVCEDDYILAIIHLLMYNKSVTKRNVTDMIKQNYIAFGQDGQVQDSYNYSEYDTAVSLYKKLYN